MRAIIPERYGRGIVRALVVSNMLADAAHPERGRFVRDQVDALRMLEGVDVELFEFPPGPRALAGAARILRSRFGGASTFSRRPAAPPKDVVHAHFGLTAWPALGVSARVRALTVHGTDLRHPRTRLATLAVMRSLELIAAVSEPLLAELPRALRARAEVLPCGVDVGRFVPIERERARVELGRDAKLPYVLFPADPSRSEKRHDRALELARAAGVELVALGGTDPARVPLWVNGANAVLVPSEREGFGLGVLEALACDVPVLATPVGIHPDALAGVEGTLCAPFELARWRTALEAHLHESDPRVRGRAAAERFSASAMALRVADAWRRALERSGHPSG
jgi:teichuronic acid biosynthesis glycosyltransferase TuaC